MDPDQGALQAALDEAHSGGVAAFNLLVQHHQRQVYNLCFRTLGNPEDAADATQEAFLSAYRGLDSFRGSADAFRGWLLRIAVNACYDLLRRKKRRPADSLEAQSHHDDGDNGGGAPIVQLRDPTPGPEQRAMSAETARRIQAALDRLVPEQRIVVVLCDIQGQSYEEAAAAMGVELGTVKSRLSRARARLRELLIADKERPGVGQRLED